MLWTNKFLQSISSHIYFLLKLYSHPNIKCTQLQYYTHHSLLYMLNRILFKCCNISLLDMWLMFRGYKLRKYQGYSFASTSSKELNFHKECNKELLDYMVRINFGLNSFERKIDNLKLIKIPIS